MCIRDSQHGVGFAIRNNLLGAVERSGTGTERILTLRLSTEAGPTTIVSTYAPTLSATKDAKDDFYDKLSATISSIPSKEELIILGDFNARVGADHCSWPSSLGKFGVGKMNENGQRLLELCTYHNLCVANSTSRPSPSIKFPGCIPVQNTGISSILSWSDAVLFITFSIHALITVRIVTRTTHWCAAKLNFNQIGSIMAKNKEIPA